MSSSLTSLQSRRSYRYAMDEFIEWYCSEPRLALNRTVVLRYRLHLEAKKLTKLHPERGEPRRYSVDGVTSEMDRFCRGSVRSRSVILPFLVRDL